ncbi:Asp-tRNA(Asn)/Glu-tRNA(Gln) amidotransferase A subunit family amidase [Stella humosa]|uniref:Asp-tRNA(Asn)/Glu-tRNA(Gln) amidotransferase A subunit family amidase n=1 Tax=Stella humosa TaxID=94 RepID=A0A3N1M1D9_9PROT|nr:amidase [Stella humosa]ROP99521.1 Asp-tRNA(Asn)/Glu-tRNA(Gln) amidotransferase A subunit family amidase [Stella humosa]BBK31265.1 amidase [Stella humosa]
MADMDQPERLSATAAARAIADGQLSAEALTRACLARIAARDATIRAWTHLDPDGAIAAARAADARPASGPLHGLPVGIKDIFDVAGMPAERGSPIHHGRRPVMDADCVTLARAAGAIIPGKTVTTEFACFHPGPTTNPANTAHTPGGSSSGSAASVADGHVPLAYGSQTVGSVIRPAAFCGVVGMKLTRGSVPLAGTMALSPSFDTLGAFAREARDLFLLLETWSGTTPAEAPARPRLGWCRTPLWDLVDPAYRAHLDAILAQLAAAGAEIVPLDLPPEFAPMREIHRAIFTMEALQTLGWEWTQHRAQISPRLADLLAEAEARPAGDLAAAQTAAEGLRQRFDKLTAGLDAVLAPSSAGEAPRGLDYTGDPSLNGMWTLLHGPLVHVPHGRGPNGLPLGIQLVGRRGTDAGMVAIADWMERSLRRSTQG